MFSFIKSALPSMPAYTLIEVLTMVRKSYQNGHLEKYKTIEMAVDIHTLLKKI